MKVRHLSPCVDAGVGAARADDAYLLSAHLRERVLDLALYGSLTGLGLPTVKIRALVFYPQDEAAGVFGVHRQSD